MTEPLTLVLAWVAGGALGAMFFGGLWWTVQKVLSSTRPAVWFLGSLLLRMSLTLAGFYVVAGGHWQRLLACLLGFVIARLVVIRLTGAAKKQTYLAQEAGNALSPDEIIFWQLGFFKLNATIVFTWALMAVLVVGSMLITRTLSPAVHRSRWQNLLEIVVTGVLGTLILLIAAASLRFFTRNAIVISTCVLLSVLLSVLLIGYVLIRRARSTELKRSRWQNLLEIVVTGIEKQIEEVGLREPRKYLGFLGTLFLFVAAASLGTIIPGFEPPTGSLSTTTALALCVFVAVPLFGIAEQGVGGYLGSYVKPTFIMLPFNIISEISRTLALAVRLFGNMMSGAMIIAILLTITPFIFPIVMTLLGLLTGMVQAYIFSILAAVYIAAATQVRKPKLKPQQTIEA